MTLDDAYRVQFAALGYDVGRDADATLLRLVIELAAPPVDLAAVLRPWEPPAAPALVRIHPETLARCEAATGGRSCPPARG